MTVLERWHDYLRTRDQSALGELLHPDVVFESPVVHTPQRGREIATRYLAGAAWVLGGPSFGYEGEWRNDQGVVLEFATEIEGVRINGVDIITFSDDTHQITRFKVMIRPLKAISLVHRLMGEHLATPERTDL